MDDGSESEEKSEMDHDDEELVYDTDSVYLMPPMTHDHMQLVNMFQKTFTF